MCRDTTVIHFVDTLRAFVAKIKSWSRKVTTGIFPMFENFPEVAKGKAKEIVLTPKLICAAKNFPDIFLI